MLQVRYGISRWRIPKKYLCLYTTIQPLDTGVERSAMYVPLRPCAFCPHSQPVVPLFIFSFTMQSQAAWRRRRSVRMTRALLASVVSKMLDEASGAHYYFNSLTGETSWSKPALFGAEARLARRTNTAYRRKHCYPSSIRSSFSRQRMLGRPTVYSCPSTNETPLSLQISSGSTSGQLYRM